MSNGRIKKIRDHTVEAPWDFPQLAPFSFPISAVSEMMPKQQAIWQPGPSVMVDVGELNVRVMYGGRPAWCLKIWPLSASFFAYLLLLPAGHWDSMEEYTCMIPRDTHDGAFYRAVLALHQDLFSLAQQVSYVTMNKYTQYQFHFIYRM